MSRFMHVLVDSSSAPEMFAREMEVELGIPFEPRQFQGESWFESGKTVEPLFVWLNQWDPEEDGRRSIEFSGYRYQLRIDADTWADDTGRRNRKQDVGARAVFDKLKATRRYRLLMLDNLETIIDRFEPPLDN